MLIHPIPIISSELRPKGKHDKDEKRTTCQRSNKNAYQMIFCKDIRCNTVFFLFKERVLIIYDGKDNFDDEDEKGKVFNLTLGTRETGA